MTSDGVHRRKNLLTGDWVLVSPHRLARPWQGAVSTAQTIAPDAHDPDCYLCPGNLRSNGVRNPNYLGPFVFDNDFPALLSASEGREPDKILVSEAETGLCRVICYSPEHNRPMSHLSSAEIRGVIDVWRSQTRILSARDDIGAIFVFENRGEMMGASNPHPHGQIWATRSVPSELAAECQHQRDWLAHRGNALLSDVLERELADGARVVDANGHFVALVPFWAAWPFEILLLPRHPAPDLPSLSEEACIGLADILGRLTRLYDAVFDAPFPYTMGWHQRPPRTAENDGFIVHAHVYPPLLRSATVRKFMVGFEMLAMPQRDLTPEAAADILRDALRRVVK